jgi:glycosyltransferase involved in cell wall biosynthesis
VKILVVTQYFWPESFRINELVKSLVDLGCEVAVIAGQPNYPEGRVLAGYSALSIREELHEHGYTIYRVPLAPRGNASGARLALNYLSFVATASIIGPWQVRARSFDVVLVYAPSPITQAIPGIVLKRVKGAKLVTWVQDLWPESLESTGFVKNQVALKAVEWVVRWIYCRNDLLLGQSRSFVAAIGPLAAGVPVEYFPNPGEGAFQVVAGSNQAKLQLGGGFNVVFAGNLGRVQALDTIISAAEQLRHSLPDVRFVLVGSGSRSQWLEEQVAQRELTNVDLPGRFASEDMPAILAQASVLLVSLKRTPIMSQTIPAKLQAYLAAGRPVIASLDGEGANLIAESGAGLAVPAEDAVALAGAVAKLWSASADDRARMGDAGRRFYHSHFAPEVLARQLLERLRLLVK